LHTDTRTARRGLDNPAMDLVVELSKVIENAMHCFDALPNAGARAEDGLRAVAAGGVGGRSAGALRLRLLLGAFFAAAFWLVRDSIALLGVVGLLAIVAAVLVTQRGPRTARWSKAAAAGAMDESLRRVVEHLAAFRGALPTSHQRLAVSLEAIEERMLRIFSSRDGTLATALVKLTCKVFGYPGFDRLAGNVAGVSNALGALRFALAQEAAVRMVRNTAPDPALRSPA
jgi:hypothetical protein